jgi:glycosyltransferase involved in cell wall biosynthesis
MTENPRRAIRLDEPLRSTLRATLVIPAYNEEPVIESTLRSLPAGVFDRVIVAVNGSTDRTAERARAAGAEVVETAELGYGAACLAVLDQAGDDILVFLQADGSEDAREAVRLIEPIRNNEADLVIGSRVLGEAAPGALLVHQQFGNWLAAVLMRLRFGYRYTDLGPFRAIRASDLRRLGMRERAYGWTVEMQIRAPQAGLRVIEVPVSSGLRRAGSPKVAGNLSASLKAGYRIIRTVFAVR